MGREVGKGTREALQERARIGYTNSQFKLYCQQIFTQGDQVTKTLTDSIALR